MNARVSVLLCVFAISACSSGDAPTQSSAPHPGAELVKANCKVCHAQGINGAPIIGNRKMWGPRLEQGQEVLVQHAINGFGLMPAKGGKTHLSDEQIAIAVDFMVSQVQP